MTPNARSARTHLRHGCLKIAADHLLEVVQCHTVHEVRGIHETAIYVISPDQKLKRACTCTTRAAAVAVIWPKLEALRIVEAAK